ncbi:MAG: FAD:protein FMN transferase, partial [Gemella haemolysans]|nr:FAD:protein FMN transferase [Gemella haemolysans]
LSIISRKSVDGEIWTTRLFGKDIKDILEEVNNLPDIECVIVTTEGKVYYTSGVLDKIIC